MSRGRLWELVEGSGQSRGGSRNPEGGAEAETELEGLRAECRLGHRRERAGQGRAIGSVPGWKDRQAADKRT